MTSETLTRALGISQKIGLLRTGIDRAEGFRKAGDYQKSIDDQWILPRLRPEQLKAVSDMVFTYLEMQKSTLEAELNAL